MHHGAPIVFFSDNRRIGRRKRLQSIELAKSRRLKGTNGGPSREEKIDRRAPALFISPCGRLMANL